MAIQPSDVSVWNILAGACGAIIPTVLREGLTPKQVVATCFCGTALSVFGSPALNDWMNVTNPHYTAFFALLAGLLGMRACELLLKWFDKHGKTVSETAGKILEALGGKK